MYEYSLTGRPAADNCIKLANEAHNLYFANPLGNASCFISVSRKFFDEAKRHLESKTNTTNFKDALHKTFGSNNSKIRYFSLEFEINDKRLDILSKNPSLINKDTLFIIDYVAGLIEFVLPYICSVKEEVEEHRKFPSVYDAIVDKREMYFARTAKHQATRALTKEEIYMKTFEENAWRAQKELFGIKPAIDKLKKSNPTLLQRLLDDASIKECIYDFGIDQFASLIFARMANEQFMKYATGAMHLFENKTIEIGFDKSANRPRLHICYDNDDIKIKMNHRIEELERSGTIDSLIANEARLVNLRGNNIAHNGIPAAFSACYHNIRFLNYCKTVIIPKISSSK